MQAATAVVSLHIYTGSPEPSFLGTGISTKNKSAGSFDIFFVILVIIHLARFEIRKIFIG